MPLIDASEKVKGILDDIKEEEGIKTYDGAIRHLLWETGRWRKEKEQRGEIK